MKPKKEKVTQTPEEQVEIKTPEAEDVLPKESKAKRIANTVINVILVIAIILAAICTYVSFVSTSGSGTPNILGLHVFSIQTDSMYDTLLPGDLIFGTKVDPDELVTGDIITYWTVINGERVLNTHRITMVADGGGYRIFETKGDKNAVVDALTVHESSVVAKYSGVRISGVGKAFDYLQTSTGFLLVVVVPVFLFFLFHLVQFFRVLFEYQNVKNRIKFEQERGRTEDLITEQESAQAAARAALEAELREKLKAEIMASMQAAQAPPAEEPAPTPAESVEPEPAEPEEAAPAEPAESAEPDETATNPEEPTEA